MVPWKKIFTSWRVILLLVFLVFAVVAIQPHFWGNEGVTIKSVVSNYSAAQAGMQSPAAKLAPLAKEKIIAFNGEKVTSLADYYRLVDRLEPNRTLRIETNQGAYHLITPFPNNKSTLDLGLKVAEAPTSNLRKGLDLEGGTRVLLKPAETVSKEDLETTVDILKERLNVYGLGDVVVRTAADLVGENYILIEIAGATEEEVKELLAKQGKFEAKIGNGTVFLGGKKDITYVCRSADCSGIDPRGGCSKAGNGYACGFLFSIALSPEAAEKQARLTEGLKIVTDSGGSFLSEELVLFLDDREVDRLKIGAELKGRATTDVQISGSGAGLSQAEAMTNALQNMKRLQTILITGSLPLKLEVVKMDTISPSLGQEFLSNVILVWVLAILAVSTVIMVKYRRVKVIIPVVLTIIAEMILIFGFAALVGWNLDLAAIAGIIIVAGTAVDHLIVITDETLRGQTIFTDWKGRLKNAMFIIMGAYLTGVASMLPLWSVGAGMLKGFAFTTIVGLSFGVLVARPAYAAVIEILMKE